MWNSVFIMLKRSFIWCYTICMTAPLKFHDRIALYNLFLTNRCKKDRKLSEYLEPYNLFFQNLLFWGFEFQDDLIYYIKWHGLLGE